MSPALSVAAAFPEAGAFGERLRERGLTIACAESCTGGLLGAALTAFAGSSDYMRGGVVSYADNIKTALLDVDVELLTAHGAVSEPVALAMAEGVIRVCDADLGLAVTGVAGPGASIGKPAGLIFVAAARRGGETLIRRLEGDQGREGNRELAVRAAIALGLELVG